MAFTREELENAYQKIQEKSAVDKDFRGKLLSNPNAAIKEELGMDLPDSCKLKIVEADPDYMYTLVIPAFRGEELSASDLDGVAGGSCGGQICGAYGCEANAEK